MRLERGTHLRNVNGIFIHSTKHDIFLSSVFFFIFFFINVSSKETEFKTDKNQKRALQGPTYVQLCTVLTPSASRCGNNKDRDLGYKE